MFDEPKLNRHNAPRKRRVASIAQSVEQGIENPRVGGSIPPRGTISSLVQSVERWTVNPYVAGSSPAGGAKFLFWFSFRLSPFTNPKLVAKRI